jgi:hypothetical protein
MKKKTLLPAVALVMLLSTTFLATAYRQTVTGAQSMKEQKLAKEDENDFEGALHGEFIWESLTRHLLFIKH